MADQKREPIYDVTLVFSPIGYWLAFLLVARYPMLQFFTFVVTPIVIAVVAIVCRANKKHFSGAAIVTFAVLMVFLGVIVLLMASMVPMGVGGR